MLTIAAYVYLGDRLVSRGSVDGVFHDSWSRDIRFRIKVRDPHFWKRHVDPLRKLLTYLSGDRHIDFDFLPGAKDEGQLSLFDMGKGVVEPLEPGGRIALFSGGLDSLAGALESLAEPNTNVLLVSHKSAMPSIAGTQERLCDALSRKCTGRRIQHYNFRCNLRDEKAADEAQRMRSFLYASIGFALAHSMGAEDLYIFENGVTSLNLPKRADMDSARSSRTTHPKTIHLMQKFFTAVAGKPFHIRTPYSRLTKTDVIKRIVEHGGSNLIDSTVSCGMTRKAKAGSTQCGVCSQCVDRRFAMFAAGLQECDHAGLYTTDFLTETLTESGTKTTIRDFVRFAFSNHTHSVDSFYTERLNELTEILPYWGEGEEHQLATDVLGLLKRHSEQVNAAILAMRQTHDDVWRERVKDGFFDLIDERPYLQPEPTLLAKDVASGLRRSIPVAFQRRKPAHENELNDHIQSFLTDRQESYRREYPSVWVATARAIPDHIVEGKGLLVEAKLAKNQSMARITDELCADMIKYGDVKHGGEPAHILFVVYDIGGRIADDETFCQDLQRRREGVHVAVVR